MSPESGPGHSRPEWSRQGLGSPALAFRQPGMGELLGGKGHGSVLWTRQRGAWQQPLGQSLGVVLCFSEVGAFSLNLRLCPGLVSHSHWGPSWGAPREPPPLHLLPHHLGVLPELRT